MQPARVAVLLLPLAVAGLTVGFQRVRAEPTPTLPLPPTASSFKSPSLWQIVDTDATHPAGETTRVCINSPSMFMSIFSGARLSHDSNCTQANSSLADGSRVIDTNCKPVPGARWSIRSSARIVASPDAKTIREHSEAQIDVVEWAIHRHHVSDAVTTYVGDCPVPMRSDQLFLRQGADGKFTEVLGGLAQAINSAVARHSQTETRP